MKSYTQQDMVRIAKRENNTKRSYLVVNRLQGKHIPVKGTDALEVFDSLAEKLKTAYKNEKILTGLKRISKPGLRVYASKDKLPKVLGGLGVAIISTNKGVLTDKEARKENVGGEVLAFIW